MVHGLARGIDPSPVRPYGPPKSITTEDSFSGCDTWDGVRSVLQVRGANRARLGRAARTKRALLHGPDPALALCAGAR
jgi:hypothetical protein